MPLLGLLLLVMLLPSTVDARMVGGTCVYETLIGTAFVSGREDNRFLFMFNSGGHRFTSSRNQLHNNHSEQISESVQGEPGTMYPAELSRITQGSCIPSRLNLLSTEDYQRGIFLLLNPEGNITHETDRKLAQISTAAQKLATHWPKLTLNICGQRPATGTKDYNLNLGEHQARYIAQQLEKRGVPASLMRISSSGEAPCPGDHVFFAHQQNGAWLTFHLQ